MTNSYMIFYYGSDNTKWYVYEINRSSIYTTTKYEDALKIDTKEHAFAFAEYCGTREKKDFQIIEIKSTMEVVEKEDIK